MTAVAFHFGAPDKLAYVCRLLRKAVANGARVLVLAPAQTVARLDGDLWSLSATEFVPHCADTAPAAIQTRSAVVLASDLTQAPGQRQVLLNLMPSVPPQFDSFERLIEVVSNDESDRNQARVRWKDYVARGYQIARHDLALKGNAA